MIKTKKNGQKVWVTFTFEPDERVDSVIIAGEWNSWKHEPMKRKKSGEYSITKILPIENDFQFGYKINGNRWITETECPKVPSPFESHNSLLKI
jgi:argininosuccinate synthase